jgi:hypothetical protein
VVILYGGKGRNKGQAPAELRDLICDPFSEGESAAFFPWEEAHHKRQDSGEQQHPNEKSRDVYRPRGLVEAFNERNMYTPEEEGHENMRSSPLTT